MEEEENIEIDLKMSKEEVRKIEWNEVIVLTKSDFHEDWGRILGIFQLVLMETFVGTPHQPDKALP